MRSRPGADERVARRAQADEPRDELRELLERADRLPSAEDERWAADNLPQLGGALRSDDIEREWERAWQISLPFSSGRGPEDAGCVAVYGDEEAAWRLRAEAQSRDMRERALNETHLRRLSLEDLRAMRAWDMAHFFDDCEDPCELLGCGDWQKDNGEHEGACPWSKHCGYELEVHGDALHRADPTFWSQLRKLGPTPELLARANAILHPERQEAKRPVRPNRAVRVVPRARARSSCGGPRRPGPRRVARAHAPPGGPDSDEPEPAQGRPPFLAGRDRPLAGSFARIGPVVA
jgi:hypothetical protein